MMFWQKRRPDWRSDPDLQNEDWEGRMSPRKYLATQGAGRGILGAIIGSSILAALFSLLACLEEGLAIFRQGGLFISSSCLIWLGTNKLPASPGAVGGMLLGLWLYQDVVEKSQTKKKTLLKSIAIGSISGLFALLIVEILFMFLPIHGQTLSIINAARYLLVFSPFTVVPGGCGGAFSGWMLDQDIRNGRMYGYFGPQRNMEQ